MQTIYASHSAIAPFRLLRPTRVEEAVEALADDGTACLAGGVDLVPALRAGRRVGRIVYLGGIEALKRIELTDGVLRIGASVTYARLASDATMLLQLSELANNWGSVANVRVRHAATVGGNLMAGNPYYDMLPVSMALGARLVFALPRGKTETVAADAETWPRGLLVSIEIPFRKTHRFAFERQFKPAISLVVSISEGVSRIAVGCAFRRPLCRTLSFGEDDLDRAPETIVDAFDRVLPEPDSDWIAGGAYRRTLARTLLARAARALAYP